MFIEKIEGINELSNMPRVWVSGWVGYLFYRSSFLYRGVVKSEFTYSNILQNVGIFFCERAEDFREIFNVFAFGEIGNHAAPMAVDGGLR